MGKAVDRDVRIGQRQFSAANPATMFGILLGEQLGAADPATTIPVPCARGANIACVVRDIDRHRLLHRTSGNVGFRIW